MIGWKCQKLILTLAFEIYILEIFFILEIVARSSSALRSLPCWFDLWYLCLLWLCFHFWNLLLFVEKGVQWKCETLLIYWVLKIKKINQHLFTITLSFSKVAWFWFTAKLALWNYLFRVSARSVPQLPAKISKDKNFVKRTNNQRESKFETVKSKSSN